MLAVLEGLLLLAAPAALLLPLLVLLVVPALGVVAGLLLLLVDLASAVVVEGCGAGTKFSASQYLRICNDA